MKLPRANGLRQLLQNLKKVKLISEGKWQALCPAHDDHVPSLSITQKRNGRVLIHCFAGCKASKVCRAVDMKISDLSIGGPRHRRGGGGKTPPKSNATQQQPTGCSLQAYAREKRLPVSFLQALGISEIQRNSVPALRIPYLDSQRNLVATRFRLSSHKTDDTTQRFAWKSGDKPCIYGLQTLPMIKKKGFVVLVEGESDCHTLWLHQVPALGLPGATGWNEERDAGHFADIEKIYVVDEGDAGADALLKRFAESSISGRIWVVSLGKFKDSSELFLARGHRFRRHLDRALKRARPLAQRVAAEHRERRRVAWSKCRQLATCENILSHFAEDLAAEGVVGESRTAKIVYLAVTSRILDRPVSVVVKGPSSGGKSYVTERTLKYFPPSAYYTLTAMSERALIYFDEPLIHRTLTIFEAAGLAGEMGTYLLRSLLSENELRYVTVERTPEGLKPRQIVRPGPTNLLLTTTAVKLHPENETRLLSIPVKDTRGQTRAILKALARPLRDGNRDFSVWHSLQEWIALSGNRVAIPYARRLAKRIRPGAVRLRRDFGMVLSLIRAHALLQQATRRRNERGDVIATLEDYAMVRELVGDLLAEGLEASVSMATRETVLAVKKLLKGGKPPPSLTVLMKALKLDKSTTSRRVKVAMESGLLRNEQDQRGRPMRLRLGERLPENTSVLPLPESI
jgi:hypothetical protein